MNPETIIAQLEQINSWRRGEESEPQPDPKHVGEVIDAAVASLRSLVARSATACSLKPSNSDMPADRSTGDHRFSEPATRVRLPHGCLCPNT